MKEESTTVFWPGVCVSATEMKSGIHRPARTIIVLDYSVVLVLFVKVLSVSFRDLRFQSQNQGMIVDLKYHFYSLCSTK